MCICSFASLIPFATCWWKSRRASRWPTVTGTITKSDLTPETDHTGGPSHMAEVLRYHPQVVYAYEVDGTSYRNSRVSHLSLGLRIKVIAEGIAGRHTVGSSVKVYYDPKHPQNAVIEPRRAARISLLISLLLVAGSLSGLAIATLPVWCPQSITSQTGQPGPQSKNTMKEAQNEAVESKTASP